MGFWPTLASGFARVQADAGDTRFVNYLLEHGWRAFTFRAAWLDPPFFFPQAGVAAYSETLWPLALVYGPFRLLLPADTAMQAWMLAVSALNFWVGWALLRRVLGAGAWGAAVGAFLVAFGSPRLSQLNHQHLLAVFFSLGAVWAAARVLQPDVRRPWAWSAALAACLVAQVAAGLYLGFFLGVFAALCLAVAVTLRDARARLRATWPRLAAAAVVVGLAALPFVRLYSGGGVAHDFGTVKGYVPELHSWLHVGPEHWLYGWTSSSSLFERLPAEGEHRLGVGLVTLGLVAWGFWALRRRPEVRVVGLAALLLGLLALRWRGGVTPWELVYRFVPGGAGLRVVARVGVFMLLPFSLSVAWALSALEAKRRLALALGLVVMLEQGRAHWSYDKVELRARVARVAAQVPPAGCAAFYATRPTANAYERALMHLDAMWAAVETGVPTVNGYSGKTPPRWDFDALPDDASLEAALERWWPGGKTCLVQVQ